jgi:type II secretion system protein C
VAAVIIAAAWLAICVPWTIAQLAAPGHSNLPRSSDSALGLTIMGTIVRAGTGSGVALVKENSSGSVKAVKSGNPVASNNYVVQEVHAKYMILQRADKSLLLVFQDKFAREFSGGKIASDPAPKSLASSSTDYFREEGFERNRDQVKMSAAYRDKLVNQELAKVLMQATAEPAVENGAIVGFKFSQIDPDSVYAKSGLRDDDIVTGINGQKLNSVGDAVTLLKSLKNADQLDIEFKRSATPQRIQINVN